MNPVQRAALKAKIEQNILPPRGGSVMTKPKPAPLEVVVKTDPQPPKPKKKKSKYYEHSRLPDGARFEAKYNAELQEWHGELILVNAVNDIYTFTDRSSGVFRLLMKLDTLYRKHLEKSSLPSETSGVVS